MELANASAADVLSLCVAEQLRDGLNLFAGEARALGDLTVDGVAADTEGAVTGKVPLGLLSLAVIPLALLCMVAGRVLVRPSVALIGFFVGAIAALEVLYTSSIDVPCDVALGVVLVTGLLVGAVCAFLVRVAIFLLGFAMGVVTLIGAAELLPVIASQSWMPFRTPDVVGYPLLPFWGIAGVAGLAIGILCRLKSDTMLIVLTAALGAYALVFGIRLATEGRVPEWATAVTMVGGAFASIALQLDLRAGGRWVRCLPCREHGRAPPPPEPSQQAAPAHVWPFAAAARV